MKHIRKTPQAETPGTLGTVHRRISSPTGLMLREHRHSERDAQHGHGYCVTFPEVLAPEAEEFNGFCRTLCTQFLESAKKQAKKQRKPYCALCTLSLSPAARENLLTLSLSAHRGDPTGHLHKSEKQFLLSRESFCFLPPGLDKKSKKLYTTIE